MVFCCALFLNPEILHRQRTLVLHSSLPITSPLDTVTQKSDTIDTPGLCFRFVYGPCRGPCSDLARDVLLVCVAVASRKPSCFLFFCTSPFDLGRHYFNNYIPLPSALTCRHAMSPRGPQWNLKCPTPNAPRVPSLTHMPSPASPAATACRAPPPLR